MTKEPRGRVAQPSSPLYAPAPGANAEFDSIFAATEKAIASDPAALAIDVEVRRETIARALFKDGGKSYEPDDPLLRVINAMRQYRDSQQDLAARVVAGELLTIVEDIREAQDPNPRDRTDDRGAKPVDREQRGVSRGDPAADLRGGPLNEVAPSTPEPSVERLARLIARYRLCTPFGVYDPPLEEGAGGGQINVPVHNAIKVAERERFEATVALIARDYAAPCPEEAS